MSDAEMQERNAKHKMTMMAAIRRNPKLPPKGRHTTVNELDEVTSQNIPNPAATAAVRASKSQAGGTQQRPNSFAQSLHYATK